jgi:hypothetical protein
MYLIPPTITFAAGKHTDSALIGKVRAFLEKYVCKQTFPSVSTSIELVSLLSIV